MADNVKPDNIMTRPLSEEHAKQLIEQMTEHNRKAAEEGKN